MVIKEVKKKVEKTDIKGYSKSCQYCSRVFESTNENQVRAWHETHERYCKKNPSNKKDNE
ncbi:MAG: hypothetical protein OEL87_00100 [Nanoarchaeota archaeon]|nr:hypothetical protein [Nanoarchaeota archaeon]